MLGKLLAVAALITANTLIACSSDTTSSSSGGEDAGASSCAAAVASVCDHACACTGGGMCAIGSPTDTKEPPLTFTTASCPFTSLCNGDAGGFDPVACNQALASATCYSAGVDGGAPIQALDLPDACKITVTPKP